MSRINRATAMITAGLIAAGTVATLTGCGFIAAGQSNRSKPSAFVLFGHAAVALPATDHRAVGTGCVAPSPASDIAAKTEVKVTDPSGKTIALGLLGPGVIAHDGANTDCDFPFTIPGVLGGMASYGVGIGGRPAQTFQGSDLLQNAPAIITITP